MELHVRTDHIAYTQVTNLSRTNVGLTQQQQHKNLNHLSFVAKDVLPACLPNENWWLSKYSMQRLNLICLIEHMNGPFGSVDHLGTGLGFQISSSVHAAATLYNKRQVRKTLALISFHFVPADHLLWNLPAKFLNHGNCNISCNKNIHPTRLSWFTALFASQGKEFYHMNSFLIEVLKINGLNFTTQQKLAKNFTVYTMCHIQKLQCPAVEAFIKWDGHKKGRCDNTLHLTYTFKLRPFHHLQQKFSCSNWF